jgi:sec-independent protein translocase protein TatB
MNFLGIGPGEIFLILIVLLVFVGPERLPEFARQAGRLLVRARNWLQTSPDAALVLRARQELDQELASIRTSLMEEVQTVRKEMIGAAKQLEESVTSIATNTQRDLNNTINPPASVPHTKRVDQPAEAQGEPNQPADPGAEPVQTAPETWAETPAAVAEAAPLEVETEPIGATPPAPILSPSEVAKINLQLQAAMTDLWALQEQLRQHGLLDTNWQPPSFTMHIPDDAPAPSNGRIEEVP